MILSVLGCFGITALAAVICGHLARRSIARNPHLTGGGLALAGLIVGYFFLFFWVLMAPQFPKIRQKAIDRQRAMSERMQAGAPAPSSSPGFVQPSRPPKPDGAVSGSISGTPFAYSKSTLDTKMGLLSINDGEGFIPDQQVMVFLFPKPGESFENRTWMINASSSGTRPNVHLRWQQGGMSQSAALPTGYELQLRTGAIKDGVITGSLNLKTAGKVPAELKGNFSAVIE